MEGERKKEEEEEEEEEESYPHVSPPEEDLLDQSPLVNNTGGDY